MPPEKKPSAPIDKCSSCLPCLTCENPYQDTIDFMKKGLENLRSLPQEERKKVARAYLVDLGVMDKDGNLIELW
jgi:hypothetical protein